MLRPVRTAAPAPLLLVTLAQAKEHSRIDDSDNDAALTSYISAAESYLDGYSGILGRALLTQTWEQKFGCFENVMRLPVGIAIAVSAFTYFDAANVSQATSPALYDLFTDEIGSYIALKPNQQWPNTYWRDDAITVTWTAGYGPAASDVPADIKSAMKLLVGHWYENREAVNVGNITSELPLAVNALLQKYRRVGV